MNSLASSFISYSDGGQSVAGAEFVGHPRQLSSTDYQFNYAFKYNVQFDSLFIYLFASLIGGILAGIIHLFHDKKVRERLKFIKKQ